MVNKYFLDNFDKLLVFCIFSLLISGFAFANHTTDEDLQICSSFSNSLENCSNYLTLTKEVSQIVDLSYSKDQDLNSYIDCVENQKQALNFDYVSVRNNCYMEQAQTSLKPKLNCFSNLDGNLLNITCKGILSSDDYALDFGISADSNKNIAIEPKLQLNPNFSFDGSRFILFDKNYDISQLNLPIANKMYFLPLSIEIKSNVESLENLYKAKNIKNITLDPVSRANLDCIGIKILMGQKLFDKYSIKKSGFSVLFSPDQIISSCSDDVSYTFSLNLDTYNSKRRQFFDIVDLRINNFLSDSNFSTDNMINELSEIIDEYKKFYIFEASLNEKTDITLKLSLDTDYFLTNLQKVTKSLQPEEKKQVLTSAGPTILKNKEDNLSVRRKNKLSAILDFFEKDRASIKDDSIKDIYYDIENSLIKNYFEDSNKVDITDVSATISSSGISLDKFVFDMIKPLYLEYDNNNSLSILKDQNGLIISLKDYNVNTLLPLNVSDNQILVNNKAIIFIDLNTLKEMFRGNAQVDSVILYFEDTLPVYVVKKEIIGKLLGIIKVKELVTTKYFATTGLVSSVQKPWWDFLIVYN